MRAGLKRVVLGSAVIFVWAAVFLLAVKITAGYLVYEKGVFLIALDPARFNELQEKDPPYQFAKPFYEPSRSSGWRHTPENKGIFRGFSYPRAEFRVPIKINSTGFRSWREFAVKQDQSRILILGDSLVQGLQVREDETLTAVLEKNLNAKSSASYQVYNFGLSSTGTAHQYRLFFKWFKLEPRIVILSFFPNDLTDNSPVYSREEHSLYPRYEKTADGRIAVADFNPEFKPDGLLIYDFDMSGFKKDAGFAAVEALRKLGERFPFLLCLRFGSHWLSQVYGAESFYHPQFDIYKKVYPPALEESVAVTMQLLTQLNEECQRRNIAFVVALMPAKEQIVARDWKGYLRQRRFVLKEEDFDVKKPTAVLKRGLSGRGIHFLDLSADFKAVRHPEKLYYPKDRHLTREGHRVAATALERFLSQSGLLNQ